MRALSPRLSKRVVSPFPRKVVRRAVSAGFFLRLSPIDAGWLDLALLAPLMNTDKAQRELGFRPKFSAERAVRDLMVGLHEGAGMQSVPLRPRRRVF